MAPANISPMDETHKNKIIVVGSSCLDFLIDGAPGIPALNWPTRGRRLAIDLRQTRIYLGGSGFSVAYTLARKYSRDVALITAVGRDEGGLQLKEALKNCRVSVCDVGSVGWNFTAHSYIILEGGDPSCVSIVGASEMITTGAVKEKIKELLLKGPDDGYYALVIAGIGVMPQIDRDLNSLAAVCAEMRSQYKLQIVIDVALFAEESVQLMGMSELVQLVSNCDYCISSIDGARVVARLLMEKNTGLPVAPLEPQALAGWLIDHIPSEHRPRTVVINCGSEGCVLATTSPDRRFVGHVPAPEGASSQYHDSVGAGDAWLATFVSSLVDTGSNEVTVEALLNSVTKANGARSRSICFPGATGWIDEA